MPENDIFTVNMHTTSNASTAEYEYRLTPEILDPVVYGPESEVSDIEHKENASQVCS